MRGTDRYRRVGDATGDIRVHLGELECGIRGPGGQMQRSEELRGSLGCRGQLGEMGGSGRCGTRAGICRGEENRWSNWRYWGAMGTGGQRQFPPWAAAVASNTHIATSVPASPQGQDPAGARGCPLFVLNALASPFAACRLPYTPLLTPCQEHLQLRGLQASKTQPRVTMSHEAKSTASEHH